MCTIYWENFLSQFTKHWVLLMTTQLHVPGLTLSGYKYHICPSIFIIMTIHYFWQQFYYLPFLSPFLSHYFISIMASYFPLSSPICYFSFSWTSWSSWCHWRPTEYNRNKSTLDFQPHLSSQWKPFVSMVQGWKFNI